METFDLIRAERVRLADELSGLSDEEWSTSSLCGGWTAHAVAAHLNMPWEVSSPAFVVAVLKALGNVDRAMDQQSRNLAERLSPAGCVQGLRENAGNRFTAPGFGPEAPLTDVVMHGADILHPLGRRVEVDHAALQFVLEFLTTRKARAALSARPLDGVEIHVTDLDLRIGTGPAEVHGPALAVCGTLLRRQPFLDELDGPGVAVLRST